MRVEVCYALADEQVVISLELPSGATVHEAIRASGLCERFPQIDLERDKVGVFGRLVALGARLRPADRIEIYRPLVADPKQMRRQRAQAQARKRLG